MLLHSVVISAKELESTPIGPQMTPKPGQGSNESWKRRHYFPLLFLTIVKQTCNVFCVRAPPAQCHPKDPPSAGESCKRSCCPPSSCLWAHLSWTIFPLCSRWTPREGPVGYSCSAELDEEACDPWNTCSRSRWVTCTQGDHIIMWSIKVWFTLAWLCVPSCSRLCGVCCQQGWCMLYSSL